MSDSNPSQGDHAAAMGRRRWLRGFAAAVVALSCGSALVGRPLSFGNLDVPAWLASFGGDFLGNRAALKQLGAAYLAMHPDEGSLRRLSRLLSANGTKSMRLHLIEGIAEDWVEHDVTVVDGWVLARTEARICAALHLMDGPRA
jgi:hypothetical protein